MRVAVKYALIYVISNNVITVHNVRIYINKINAMDDQGNGGYRNKLKPNIWKKGKRKKVFSTHHIKNKQKYT